MSLRGDREKNQVSRLPPFLSLPKLFFFSRAGQASLVAADGVRASAVTLLSNGKLDTLALGQGDPGLLGADDKDVGLPGSEGVVNGVLDVDDVETTIVALTVSNDTDTTHVTTTSDHGNVADLEADKVVNLASGEAVKWLVNHFGPTTIDSHVGRQNLLDLDSVIDLDQRIRVADAVTFKVSHQRDFLKTYQPYAISLRLFLNLFSLAYIKFVILFRGTKKGVGEERIQPKLGPTADRCRKNSRSRIMRNQEWDTATAQLDALDLAELVLGLLGLDAVDREAALGVVDEAEVLARLLDGDDVHEAGRVGRVGADLAVDLDQALHQDGLGLAVVQRVLEAVADEDDQGQAVAGLVGTGRGLGSVATGQLVQQPVLGGAEALLVLLSCKGEVDVSIFINILIVSGTSLAESQIFPQSAKSIANPAAGA